MGPKLRAIHKKKMLHLIKTFEEIISSERYDAAYYDWYYDVSKMLEKTKIISNPVIIILMLK